MDLIGRSFSFTHAKGLAEWLKNSWDAYQRHPERLTEAGPLVVLQFLVRGKSFHEVRVIDFCGMSGQDIDRAFKRWFDMRAATKGAGGAAGKILGGHGNGGKFYMRQMFGESRIITWSGGKLNEFGFNQRRQYGYAKGRQEVAQGLDSAASELPLSIESLPVPLSEALLAGRAGFTVVKGWKPAGAGLQTQWVTSSPRFVSNLRFPLCWIFSRSWSCSTETCTLNGCRRIGQRITPTFHLGRCPCPQSFRTNQSPMLCLPSGAMLHT